MLKYFRLGLDRLAVYSRAAEEFCEIFLGVEVVDEHVVGVELQLCLDSVVKHDSLLLYQAQLFLQFNRGNTVPRLPSLHSLESALLKLLRLPVSSHGLPERRDLRTKLAKNLLQLLSRHLLHQHLGLGVKLVEPKSHIEMIVLEQVCNGLQVAFVLTIDVNVLTYDFVPFGYLLRPFLTVSESRLLIPVTVPLHVHNVIDV